MCAWLSISSYGSIVRPFSPPLSHGGARSFAPYFRPRGVQLRFPDRPPSARQLLSGGGGVGRRFGLRYDGFSTRKEEQEGKTAAMVGVFVLPERKKVEMLFLTSPYFVYLCTKPRSIYLFCQTNYYAFFSSTRFLEFVYARPVRSCEL